MSVQNAREQVDKDPGNLVPFGNESLSGQPMKPALSFVDLHGILCPRNDIIVGCIINIL